MNLTTYLNETKAELRHVKWSSRRETVAYTGTVIVLTIATAVLLGVFDSVFSLALRFLF